MRRISVCSVLLLWLLNVSAQGASEVRLLPVASVPILVGMNQTTTLLFPFGITSADWGSNGIIVQQVKAAKNILRVKAARNNFSPTNLSVVTSDGHFYAFHVAYDSSPAQLNYLVRRDGVYSTAMVTNNAKDLSDERKAVSSMRSFLHVSKKLLLMSLELSGVYVGQHAMWLTLHLTNRSWIDFPVGYVRFFVKDHRTVKRKVQQEKELFPVSIDTTAAVPGKVTRTLVYGFAPFTIPKGQQLTVQIGEKGEGRFIALRVKPRKLLRARKLIDEGR